MCEKASRTPLAAYSLESLSNVLVSAGFKRYRATQVMEWFYGKRVRDFREMKNVSSPVAAYLEEHLVPVSSRLAATHDAGDGAVKLEILLEDSQAVEAALIETPRRTTLCVSSQAGCPLGCAFCATGAGGFARSLYSYEIIEQALHALSVLEPRTRISHVVFMGMGEPCLNLDAVFDAIRTLNAPYAFGIGARRMTISTLGDPHCVRRIAEFPMEVGLAVSLHAADDSLRRRLVPQAPGSVRETVAAAMRYFEKTGREVTFEYVLLGGVNDSAQDAVALADVLQDRRVFVNLIAYNEVEGLPYCRPSPRKIAGFRRSLAARGVNAHVRESRGGGAGAACGQLALKKRPGGLT